MTRSLGSTDLKRLHRGWRRRASGRVSLLLDSVATPYNVGSIIRTAAAMRVELLHTCGSTPDPDAPAVGKTALGSIRFVEHVRHDGPGDAVAAIAATGARLIAVELAADAVPIHEADLTGDVCLAVGHEERGLSDAVLAGAATVVHIPQLGRIGSLNVATAASIALYEARRQGW